MTSNPPPTTAATQAPNAIELLWERYKSLANVIVLAIVVALGINYALTYMERKANDEKWSKFSASVGLEKAYVDLAGGFSSLTEQLPSLDAAALKAELAKADAAQKPYVLLALARRARARVRLLHRRRSRHGHLVHRGVGDGRWGAFGPH